MRRNWTALAATALVLPAVLLGATATGAAATSRTATADYPPADAGYHSYAEMADHLQALAAARPDIVRVFSLGSSHQGRPIWAAEVSDHPGEDEGEPEVLLDGLHHAREHLSAEMAIAVLDLLVSRHGDDTRLGRRVTRLVDGRRIWIVPMVDPDGLVHDLSGGPFRGHYRGWRKNRQPTPGSERIGTDLNRNWGYAWGCCGGSSGSPGSPYFRGPVRWSAPEVRAVRDLVAARVVGGRQRIRAHISFHSAGEMVLWPYGHTGVDVPADMTRLDHRAFVALGRAMAARNGYRAAQSYDLYPTDGDMIDWMYGRQRVFSFTFELHPRTGSDAARWYPPDEVIGRETRRNRDAVLYLLDRAGCPYRALGADARQAWCGPFFDDLEIARGWRTDPDGTDTASGGRWARGRPSGEAWQVGRAADGQAALVTGRARGRDVDGGATTVRSPLFRLPSGRDATLRLRAATGLGASADAGDGLRVYLVDEAGDRAATLLAIPGDGEGHRPAWRTYRAPIPGRLLGARMAIELEAVDGGADATVEAAVDQVRVTLD